MIPSEADQDGPTTAAVDLEDPVDSETRSSGRAEEACPSCDAPGSWQTSRRHRFNPFGGVTVMVVGFWAGVIGLAFGFSLWPALGLLIIGAAQLAATRTALVCKVCGFVKPRS